MVCACEDVGLAYPQIIPIVKAAVDAANMVGLPEARLPLADAVILVATSPKSNSAHDAINAAIADVQAGRTGPIPRQLQNKHFDGEDALVKGQNYKYAHSYANHWVTAAVPAGCAEGYQILHLWRQQDRAGSPGVLGKDQRGRKRLNRVKKEDGYALLKTAGACHADGGAAVRPPDCGRDLR